MNSNVFAAALADLTINIILLLMHDHDRYHTNVHAYVHDVHVLGIRFEHLN